MKQFDSGVSAKLEPDGSDPSRQLLEQANTELREENRKLRELDEHRTASLSHLAHELRTPLTSILGFSEILLSQEQLTDAQRGFVKRIQNSAQQLQNNLSQLSALTRSDTPKDNTSSG